MREVHPPQEEPVSQLGVLFAGLLGAIVGSLSAALGVAVLLVRQAGDDDATYLVFVPAMLYFGFFGGLLGGCIGVLVGGRRVDSPDLPE